MASIYRSQLKAACGKENWYLLDLLLETEAAHLNEKALFTDTWGDWWGLLMEVIYRRPPDGLRVLLKHGASRDTGRWGDGMPYHRSKPPKGSPRFSPWCKTRHTPPTHARPIRPCQPSIPRLMRWASSALPRAWFFEKGSTAKSSPQKVLQELAVIIR